MNLDLRRNSLAVYMYAELSPPLARTEVQMIYFQLNKTLNRVRLTFRGYMAISLL